MDISLTVKTRLAATAGRLGLDCMRSLGGRLVEPFAESGSPNKGPAAKRPAISVKVNALLITAFRLVFEPIQV